MNGNDVLAVVLVAISAVICGVVVYLALRGTPGVVSLSPPPGSPRWPVYGFFAPWFLSAFVSRNHQLNQITLYVRLAEFLIVLVAFFISARRAKANPAPPPRI